MKHNTAVELSDNLSSIHNAPNYGRASYGGLTTTDTSAPLGGTYSLLDNTGENAEAPITYDFMYHMPDFLSREAGKGGMHSVGGYINANYGAPTALPDRTDARFVEFADEQKHRVAHANAKDLFKKKVYDDDVARQGDYVYGTAYALDSSSPNGGVDPKPALYDEILDIEGNKTRVAGSSYHPEKGYDYAYDANYNYAGYDPLAWTTQNENGVTEYKDYADTVHPDAPLREIATNQILDSKAGDYFNTGYNLKKFSAIPTSEFGLNPAIHPANAYQDEKNALEAALFTEQQQFNQGQQQSTSPNSLLMPPSGMDSTGGGSGFGLGYSSGTGTGTGTGNYSRGYQQDILGLLDNLIGG